MTECTRQSPARSRGVTESDRTGAKTKTEGRVTPPLSPLSLQRAQSAPAADRRTPVLRCAPCAKENRDKERLDEIRDLNRATLKATGEQVTPNLEP